MFRYPVVFLAALVALWLLLATNVAALTPPTGQFTYFYKPATDGTSVTTVAALNRYIILTHGDESYRTSLKQSGYTGPVLQYLGAAEVEGPGPYANASSSCDSSFQPYHNQVAMDPGDFCKYLHPNESYFLHNANGQRLYENNGGGRYTYHMNPATAGWQDFFVQRALRELQGDASHAAMGYDGLFLDNVWVNLWSLTHMVVNSNGAYPKEYATDAAYRTAMAGFLSKLKSSLNATGKAWPVLGNMASDDYVATAWDGYLPYLDGGMHEYFATNWPSQGYPSTAEWLTDLQKGEKVAAQGKVFLAVGQGTQSDTTRMRFGYGSYLLVMQPGKSFYRYAQASDGYTTEWSYSDYNTDIGTPSGARFQQADGTWRRNFTRGYVVVNPSTHGVQIIAQAMSSVPTSTPVPPTATSVAPTTANVAPTATRTATAIAPTATRTATAIAPTATRTATAVAPTATRTPVPATATPVSSGGTVTFNPAADAYVNSTYPDTNYGTAAQLRIDDSPATNSYLRFNVQGLSGSVAKATLYVYANSALSAGYYAQAVANTTWSESTIAFSNAPSIDNSIGWSGAVSSATWTAVDVTAYVTGNGTFSLALTDPSVTALSLASRESATPPRLVITTR